MSEDERAIREVIATWLRASAAGDTQKVLSSMADDVVFLVPGHKPFGKEAFAAAQQGLEQYRMEADSQLREIRVFGDWAYCWTDVEEFRFGNSLECTRRRWYHFPHRAPGQICANRARIIR